MNYFSASMVKTFFKTWVSLAFLGSMFLAVSYFSQRYHLEIQALLKDVGILGPLVYLLLLIISVIVVVFSSAPLIPLAALLWGGFWAGTLTVLGWTLGSIIAYLIAKKWGMKVVGKFVSEKKIERVRKMIPQSNMFWGIVFLRLTLPVDILSYTLGIFSLIPLPKYIVATVLGVIPFSYTLAFTGTFPWYYQMMVFAGGAIIFITVKAMGKFK